MPTLVYWVFQTKKKARNNRHRRNALLARVFCFLATRRLQGQIRASLFIFMISEIS
jgi:hypothetical protein